MWQSLSPSVYWVCRGALESHASARLRNLRARTFGWQLYDAERELPFPHTLDPKIKILDQMRR